uniref:Dysbindin n=2 Tax=Lygus hesperus TaxID=30085 RepID=A0A0A9VSD6_LYGHE
MLSSIIEKLNVVQDGISSSFRGLTVGQPIPRQRPEYTAGCELLTRYQNSWQDLTNAAEYNANLAREIDQTITTLHNSVLKKKQVWSSLHSEMMCLDDVVTSTESVVNMIGKLRMDISEMEEDLIRLENLIETEEFYRKQENERTKLNWFREQKLENLDKYRATLSARHSEKMKKKEEEESFVKQVKTEVLEKRFAKDMANYKSFGVLPETTQLRPQSSLDDIELDQDGDELTKYLEDS